MPSRVLTCEEPLLRIPVSAATLDGFREWYKSEGVPDEYRVSYLGDMLYVELPGDVEPGWVEIPISAIATLDGFRAWATSDDFPERGRISFIGEEIFVDMSPEELFTHNLIKMEIARILGNLIRRYRLGRFFGDRVLLVNPAADLSSEPDGTFLTWDAVKSGRAKFVQRKNRPDEYIEILGTPDWVMEIVSRGSVQKDTDVLRATYHRAEIPEYWLVNALGSRISFQILVHRPHGYVAVRPRGGWLRSPVFGRSFRLERERDPLGLWQYTLRVKAE